MKLQQFNSKMISITQLRKGIDALEEVLAREDEALIMRNQSLFFVAMTPEKYRQINGDKRKIDTVEQAIATIGKIRSDVGSKKGKTLISDYVAKMRNQRIQKWTK